MTRVIHPLLYQVEDLVDSRAVQGLASCLLVYRESALGRDASEKLKGCAVHTEESYEIMEELLELDEDASRVYVHIR